MIRNAKAIYRIWLYTFIDLDHSKVDLIQNSSAIKKCAAPKNAVVKKK